MLLRAAVMPGQHDGDGLTSLLTIAEACHRLRVSKWMVYRLIQSKQLESILIGRRRFVPHTAVEHFITELRQEAA